MTDREDIERFGPLTRDAVRIMIYDAIQHIEEKRDKQHEANLARFSELERNNNLRFDKQDAKLNRIIGAIIVIGTLVPILVHFLPR